MHVAVLHVSAQAVEKKTVVVNLRMSFKADLQVEPVIGPLSLDKPDLPTFSWFLTLSRRGLFT